MRDRNYFKQAVNTTNVVVIEPVFGRLTGAAVLQIAYPVREDSQRLKFVLLASLDLNKFIKEQTANVLHGVETILTDHRGTVLLRSPAPHRADGPGSSIASSPLFRLTAGDGTKELVNTDGETQVWSAAETIAIGGVNLRVMVGRSKSELVAAPNRRLAEDLTVLGILSILLFTGVWLLAEVGIRFQISRISKMAERLGAGELGARVLAPYPKGELGSLMTVLNGTAASLERQRHDIEDLNQKLRQSQQMETLEKQRLDIALDNMTQGLLLFDASERLVVCNRRYIEIYGLSPDVVKPGCSFRDLVAHRKLTGSFGGDVEEYCSSNLQMAQRLAAAAVRSEADRFAGNILPIVKQAQKSGATTLLAIADALNTRGVATARGGSWYPSNVRNVLARG